MNEIRETGWGENAHPKCGMSMVNNEMHFFGICVHMELLREIYHIKCSGDLKVLY